MDGVLFDINELALKWLLLGRKYSNNQEHSFSAWDVLSHHMQEYYGEYDDGLLCTIAFFGELFPDYVKNDGLMFHFACSTCEIGADLNDLEPENRYLLLRIADIMNENATLCKYVKKYTNTYHMYDMICRKDFASDTEWLDGIKDVIMSRRIEKVKRMFGKFHELLLKEIRHASYENDLKELQRMNELVKMINVISTWR